MKKIFSILLVAFLVLGIFGCTKKTKEPTESSLAFKNEYETLNGKENAFGKQHRTVSIPEVNPFEKITPEELVTKLENKETFYVYFGDPLCPWCRSVIEKATLVANKNNIDKIYYIKIWDDNGNEVLRSKYKLNKKNKPELVTPAASTYYTIMDHMKNLLKDYSLVTSDNKEVKIGEKRIYAPNFVYVENGVGIKLVTGNSTKQTNAFDELTTEMLEDEENIFNDFFTTK